MYMEYIITFKTTNYAIKAEQRLLESKIRVGVLPLPSQVRAGCGICLRIAQDDISAALTVLAKAPIDEIGLLKRENDKGKFVYTEITNWRKRYDRN